MIKAETACLTGHRPKGLPWGYDETKINCINFKSDLKEIFKGAIEYGLKNFLIGMAEGFDMIGGEMLIDLRKTYKYIKVIAVVPCKNQEVRWSAEQQKRYRTLLKKCDEVIILSDGYTQTCMNDRINIWLSIRALLLHAIMASQVEQEIQSNLLNKAAAKCE